MKKIISIIIVLSLFGCNQSEDVKTVLVNIKASGELELVPDIASISVNVSCTDKDISKSNDCTKKNIDKLFALLKEHKVEKDDYHSSRINLEKDYIWKHNSQVFRGYKTSSTINILFKDLEMMSAVLTKVMMMQSASVYNLNYSHSEIDAMENKAYLKALDSARDLADEMKNKLNGKSVEVLKISNVSDNFGTYDSGIVAKKVSYNRSRDVAAIQVNPGALKLVKDIYVQYIVRF